MPNGGRFRFSIPIPREGPLAEMARWQMVDLERELPQRLCPQVVWTRQQFIATTDSLATKGFGINVRRQFLSKAAGFGSAVEAVT